MIGLSLSSVSKHNMWSCYDWVVVVFFCLLTEDNNDNPIITRPHIVFTDGRQRQPNHNTTNIVLTDEENNEWSCYDWVAVVVFRLLTQYVVIL
jgi:hypothetical protein